MHKFVISSLSTFALAIAAMAIPTGASYAHFSKAACGQQPVQMFPSFQETSFLYVKKGKPCPTPRDNHNIGKAAFWCGFAAATSEMVGTLVHQNDKKYPRQSTIFEAGWYASACPIFLPWSLLVTATCPDNEATYEIAHQAYLWRRKTLVADYSVFTNAYAEACRKGTLSVDFRAFLKQNHMRLSGQFLRA